MDQLRREKEERERELEDENTELKGELAKLRAEMDAVLKELQTIVDSKLGLELEIAAYRKLLEGEESRVGLRKMIDEFSALTGEGGGGSGGGAGGGGGGGGGGGMAAAAGVTTKGEMSAKTTYQRSAKGPVTIPECSPDGKFVVLENTGRKDEPIGQWLIKRNVDGKEKPDFAFDQNFMVKPGAKVRVWAKGAKPSNAAEGDIECKESTWGVGANINTRLVNPAGEERATHIQKTVYS